MNLNPICNGESIQISQTTQLSVDEDKKEVTTENYDAVETLLAQMQDTLQSIKDVKKQQCTITIKVQELVAQLAEAQVEETKFAEATLDLEIKWQELTQEFKKFSEINVSCD